MSDVLIKAKWRDYIRESKNIPDRLLSVVEKRPLLNVLSEDSSGDRVSEEEF